MPALVSLVSAVSMPASGQVPKEAYHVDVHHGFLTGSRRVMGLGGAYTAIAEGADGLDWTPTAFANRPRSSFQRTDWALDFSLGGALFSTVDLDGDGEAPPANRAYGDRSFTAGLNIFSGDFGFGAFVRSVAMIPGPQTPVSSLHASTTTGGFGAGWAMRGGEFVLGFTVGFWEAQVWQEGENILEGLSDPVSVQYGAPRLDLGILYRPPGLPVRCGAALRTKAVLTEGFSLNGDRLVSRRPLDLRIPARLSVGLAVMLGPASLGWNYPMKDGLGWGEGVRQADSRYVLLSAEYTGLGRPASETLSLESFLVAGTSEGVSEAGGETDPTPEPPGPLPRLAMTPTHTLRLGAESEIIPDYLRARVGAYAVPNRYLQKMEGQVHLTGGVDIRLFRVLGYDIRGSLNFDLGENYSNSGIGLGFWEPPYTFKRAVGIPSELPGPR